MLRAGSGGATSRISGVVSPWIAMVAVVCSALSVAVILGLDNAARRLARGVRSPSVGDGSELLGTLTEREIPKLFAGRLSY